MPPQPAPLAAPDVFAFVLADLAIILVAARLVGDLFVRFKQPRVVGEIIAGILIGPTVLGGHLAAPAVGRGRRSRARGWSIRYTRCPRPRSWGCSARSVSCCSCSWSVSSSSSAC